MASEGVGYDLPGDHHSLAVIGSRRYEREVLKGVITYCCTRCLRNVVIEHLFSTKLVAREIEPCDHLLSFLQANPNISKKIQTLKLSDETLDDSAMLKLMATLPKLENLELGRFIYPSPPSNSIPPQDSPSPFSLKTFHLNTRSGRHCGFDTSTPLNPKLLNRPLRIDKLWIGPYLLKELDVKFIPFFTNAFADGIEPGSLQKLVVKPDSPAAVSAIGNLLAHVGGELRSLNVDGNGPHPVSWRGRSGWEDPLDSHWHTLGLGACPKLDSIQIHIYFRAPGDAPQPQNIPVLSLAGAGMLSQASKTLRKVTISLWDLSRVTTLNNRRMLRLQAFAKILTSDRFLVLEEVLVGVIPDWGLREQCRYEWGPVVAGVRKALPTLHSRGLLKVSWNP
ncbi:hypothetical protein V8D89_012948 [Ganoderma adspersum]